MELKVRAKNVYQSRLKQIQNLQTLGVDNDLKVKYSMEVLGKYGQICPVQPPRKRSQYMKTGRCYGNAARKYRDHKFQYVEGVATHKSTGIKISHAWNIDLDENHIDFTFSDPEEYEYHGVIIPYLIRFEVGLKNGGIDYCVLPFLK